MVRIHLTPSFRIDSWGNFVSRPFLLDTLVWGVLWTCSANLFVKHQDTFVRLCWKTLLYSTCVWHSCATLWDYAGRRSCTAHVSNTIPKKSTVRWAELVKWYMWWEGDAKADNMHVCQNAYLGVFQSSSSSIFASGDTPGKFTCWCTGQAIPANTHACPQVPQIQTWHV